MKEQIKNMILEISPTLDLEKEDLNLAEDMDSLDLISLMAELETEFDIEIGMEEKTEENFENIDSLVKMIERLR